MRPAWSHESGSHQRRAVLQGGKKCRDVIEKIRSHHGRRYRRVAHQFAGEQQGVGAAKDPVDVVEIIQRINGLFTGAGLPVHAKGLVAVNEVIQGPVSVFGELQALQDTEIAIGGLAFQVKPVFGLGGQEVAECLSILRWDGLQQFILFILSKVKHLQTLATVGLGQLDVLAYVMFFATVLGNDDLDARINARGLSAVTEAFAHLVDAFQAGAQVRGTVGDRDAEDKVVTFVCSSTGCRLLSDQCILFAEK